MSKTSVILTFACLFAIVEPLAAQERGRGRGRSDQGIPRGHLPPPGMCRIWLDGVPPGQQPAPTTCERAVRNQPPRSRVIWGENTDGYRRGRFDERERERRDDDRRRRDRDDDDRRRPDRDDDRFERDGDRRDDDRRDRGGVTTPVDRGNYPSQMPAMTGAVLIRVGVRTADVSNWIGSGDVRTETRDANGDGVPEEATWLDSQGRVVQIWRDDDRDGRADSVEVFRDGRSVRVIR